jgi:putative transcriptional regulator
MKNRLKILRAERDWSQADLAERLQISRQSVNAIETGKFDPSLPLAFRIARLFNQPIEWIFDDGLGPGDKASPDTHSARRA